MKEISDERKRDDQMQSIIYLLKSSDRSQIVSACFKPAGGPLRGVDMRSTKKPRPQRAAYRALEYPCSGSALSPISAYWGSISARVVQASYLTSFRLRIESEKERGRHLEGSKCIKVVQKVHVQASSYLVDSLIVQRIAPFSTSA